jgi:hypothetical protein
MKRFVLLIALVSLAVTLAGCSKHSRAADFLKNNNLGVINVSNGKPSSYTLADGRTCTITPTLLPSHNARLTTTITEINGSKRTLVFEVPPDGHADTFPIDNSTAITVTPIIVMPHK